MILDFAVPGPPISPISPVYAHPEQARNARLKLRANRRKARYSGSPTEVDDRSSSSAFSSPLTLCRTLPASGSLSLPPFGLSAALSRYSSLLIHLPICLSVYLCRRSSLFITPTSRAQLALGEHEHAATPRSCRWTLLCASTKEAQRGGCGTHASILSRTLSVHHTFHSASNRHGARRQCLKDLKLKVISATLTFLSFSFEKQHAPAIMWSIL